MGIIEKPSHTRVRVENIGEILEVSIPSSIPPETAICPVLFSLLLLSGFVEVTYHAVVSGHPFFILMAVLCLSTCLMLLFMGYDLLFKKEFIRITPSEFTIAQVSGCFVYYSISGITTDITEVVAGADSSDIEERYNTPDGESSSSVAAESRYADLLFQNTCKIFEGRNIHELGHGLSREENEWIAQIINYYLSCCRHVQT